MAESEYRPRALSAILSYSHGYIERFKQELDAVQPDIWAHLERTPKLDAASSKAILTILLGFACQSTSTLNIELGRAGILTIPRDWLLENIEEAAEPLVELNDDWEYRRLLEVYWMFDLTLVRKLALRGKSSNAPAIKEAAEDFLEALDEPDTA